MPKRDPVRAAVLADRRRTLKTLRARWRYAVRAAAEYSKAGDSDDCAYWEDAAVHALGCIDGVQGAWREADRKAKRSKR